MHPRIDQIIEAVSVETCITAEEILGRHHFPAIVKARHEVWRRVRTELGWSYPMIGKRFGVDGSSVVSALRGKKARREVRAA